MDQDLKRRRPRMTPAEGRALVEKWRSSGQSVAAFCRDNGIRENLLWYWRAPRKAAGAKGSKKKRDFFVVAKPNASELTASSQSDESGGKPPGGSHAVVIVVPLDAGASALAHTLRSVLREAQA